MTKSIFAKQEDGTIQLTITISKEEIKKTYDEVLNTIVQQSELSGFRKGKAPKKLVEENTDKTKIYEQIIQKVVPSAYLEAIAEYKLNPILPPKVELLKTKEGEDWEIRATTCEEPVVDLGNYKEEIKKSLASAKIWTPDQKPVNQNQDNKGDSEDEKTQKAIESLLLSIKLRLPEILIEDEVNRALSGLINQTSSLGLTIDQYLNSINKTADQVRKEYREKVTRDLSLQLALNIIAQTEKMEASESEIDSLISSLGDAQVKENFSKLPQRNYLRSILLRRKALDFIAHF